MRQYVDTPKVLGPEDFTGLVDSREQAPWDLSPLHVQTATLTTGDYTVRGLEDSVALERKSLLDLIGCCGRERERFERELQRLLAFDSRAVVVEASWAQIGEGGWPGLVTPRVVLSSIASWTAEGVPFVLAGNREGAADFARRFLMSCARHAHRRLRAFAEAMASVDRTGHETLRRAAREGSAIAQEQCAKYGLDYGAGASETGEVPAEVPEEAMCASPS